MQQSERFTRATSALVTAFLQGTLAKGHCAACACGNIVAAAVGATITPVGLTDFESSIPETQNWYYVDTIIVPVRESGLKMIAATGYSVYEIFQIEVAFEGNTWIGHMSYCIVTPAQIDEDQYWGLCAVFAVLCELEGIEDPSPYTALLVKATVPA